VQQLKTIIMNDYKTCEHCCYDILDDNGNVMGHYCYDNQWVD